MSRATTVLVSCRSTALGKLSFGGKCLKLASFLGGKKGKKCVFWVEFLKFALFGIKTAKTMVFFGWTSRSLGLVSVCLSGSKVKKFSVVLLRLLSFKHRQGLLVLVFEWSTSKGFSDGNLKTRLCLVINGFGVG